MTTHTDIDMDAYLESILKAAGSSLRHYEAYSKDAMRKVMREILAATNEQDVLAYKLDQAVNTVQPMLIRRAEDAEAIAQASELRIMELETRLEHVRKILASTDIVSLPNDYPIYQIANDRMQRIKDLTLEGLGIIGRAETAEAQVKELTAERDALKTALKIYGAHANECSGRYGPECNCGWRELKI